VTYPVDPSGIDKVLTSTIDALAKFQAQQDGNLADVEGTGAAADGMITVRTGPPGRITDLTLDPRVLRLGSEVLTEEITSAVNEALADLQEQAAVVASPTDFGGLGEQLKAIQEDTAKQLTSFTSALAAAQSRLGSGGR
jgi:DNA-binding protein YbaB